MTTNVNKTFGGWPCTFDAVTLNNLTAVEPSANVSQSVLKAMGSKSVQFTADVTRAPTVRLTTRDILEALTNVNPVGSSYGLDVSTLSKIQYRNQGDSGSAHVTLSSLAGFLHITDFGASQGEEGGMDCNLQYFGLKVGSNPIFTPNVSQPLSGQTAVNSSFTLGPVILEGTELRGVQRSRVSTGIQYLTNLDNGRVEPTDGSVAADGFAFEVTTTQIELANSLGFGKSYPITSGVNLYFVQREPGQANYENSAARHILVKALSGSYTIERMPVSGDGKAQCSVRGIVHGLPTILTNQSIPL